MRMAGLIESLQLWPKVTEDGKYSGPFKAQSTAWISRTSRMVRPVMVDSAGVVVSYFAASSLRLATISSEAVRRADRKGRPDSPIGNCNLPLEAHYRQLELDRRPRHSI